MVRQVRAGLVGQVKNADVFASFDVVNETPGEFVADVVSQLLAAILVSSMISPSLVGVLTWTVWDDSVRVNELRNILVVEFRREQTER
jgi:hypothetical protein